MKAMSRLGLLIVLGAGVWACHEERLQAPPPGPVLQVLDAEHNSGNAHFYFLPPMVPQAQFSGVFDAHQSPTVVVCRWAGAACGETVAEFSMTSGTGSEIVRVDPVGEAYSVNWDSNQCGTDPCGLVSGEILRVRVLVAGTELGFADVLVVANSQQAKRVDPNQYVALVVGRVLTIKFRIEQGAVFVIGTSGGTISAFDGRVALEFPAGALSGDVGITVAPATTVPAAKGLVPGTAFDFGPAGLTFAQPVQLTINYDPADLPPGAKETALRLHKAMGTLWHPVTGSSANESQTSVTGAITSFSSYAAVSFTWTDISAGGDWSPTTCGLSGGKAYCWGDNSWGQLGIGSSDPPQYPSPHPTPMPVTPDYTFRLISVGSGAIWTYYQDADTGQAFVCGIIDSDAALCWGRNSSGQLGNGNYSDQSAPTTVGGGHSFASLEAGNAHACAIATDGLAYCWGHGTQGIDPWYPFLPQPVDGVRSWKSIGAGFNICGVKLGKAYCWGDSEYGGPLGSDDGTTSSGTPVEIAGGLTFTSVVPGRTHTCGVTTSDEAYCWGFGTLGELGTGSNGANVPEPVAGGLSFAAVTTGTYHTCGVTVGGDAYCWGYNGYGQLGDGSRNDRAAPVLVAGGLKFESVSAGGFNTCGVTLGGEAYCWGYNGYGALGNGTTTPDSPVPVAVSVP
jgi:hypothetical protein